MIVLRVIRFLLSICIVFSLSVFAHAHESPIPSDSRIRTFIYSPDEVFRIVVHYGYQTSIEFEEGEEIQHYSLGNDYAWHLTPLGNRLFIKPLEENILTNITILTNKRAYHIEVQSKLLSYTVDEELVYVVRFFYPENKGIIGSVEQKNDVVKVTKDYNFPTNRYNFDYTLTGPDSIAPTKVFDDGINTFFMFPKTLNLIPKVYYNRHGNKVPLDVRRKGGYFVVNVIAPQFEVYAMGSVVNVFNESIIKKSITDIATNKGVK